MKFYFYSDSTMIEFSSQLASVVSICCVILLGYSRAREGFFFTAFRNPLHLDVARLNSKSRIEMSYSTVLGANAALV